MKRLVLVFSILMLTFFAACSQPTKTFDCDYFSLSYPSSFKSVPIVNAPHMVLKIEGKDGHFSASRWDSGFPKERTAWDDDIYERNKKMPYLNGSVVSLRKVLIKTNSGEVKFLKQYANTYENTPMGEIKVKALSYITIYDGRLYIFCAIEQGHWDKNRSTDKYDAIIRTLKFKSSPEPYADDNPSIVAFTKLLNSACPMEVDECMEMRNVRLVDKVVTFSMVVDDDCLDYIDLGEFKQDVCPSYTELFDKSDMKVLQKDGYSFAYLFYSKQGIVQKRADISPADILKYY